MLLAIRRIGDALSAAASCVEVVVVTAVWGGEARGARFSSRDILGSYSTLSFPGFVR